jgi:hypothetical protein
MKSLNSFNKHLKLLKEEWELNKQSLPSLPPSPVLTYIPSSNIKIHVYSLVEDVDYKLLSSIIEEFLNNMLDDGTVYNVYFDKDLDYGILECTNPYTNKSVEVPESILTLLLEHEFTLPYDSSRFEVRFIKS